MSKEKVLESIKSGLIVSCQALENEPLHSDEIMAKMAVAAKVGGAVAIRANSYKDIIKIKQEVDLPVIGLVKREYKDSSIYITPTLKEIEEIIKAGADIVATDATHRIRPYGQNLENFVYQIRKEFGDSILMADISNLQEGIRAEELSFDLVSTTLSNYTSYTKNTVLPDYSLMKSLVNNISIPVIAEGGIWTPEEAILALKAGVHAVVVGTAITRPQEITRRFVDALMSINLQASL